MDVEKLIEVLKGFNPKANLFVVNEEGQQLPFGLSWGGESGGEESSCCTLEQSKLTAYKVFFDICPPENQ